MTRPHLMRVTAITAVALLTLAACGKRGDLERPEPMWKSAPINPATPAK